MFYVKINRPEGFADQTFRALTQQEAEDIKSQLLDYEWNQNDCTIEITDQIPKDEQECFQDLYESQQQYPIR